LGRFILVKNNSVDVVKVLELSRANYNRMVQNLLWTTGYNVVALPWQLIFWLHSEQVSQKRTLKRLKEQVPEETYETRLKGTCFCT
jgi:hypothetical protein